MASYCFSSRQKLIFSSQFARQENRILKSVCALNVNLSEAGSLLFIVATELDGVKIFI